MEKAEVVANCDHLVPRDGGTGGFQKMRLSLREKGSAWSLLINICHEIINTGADNERPGACRKNRQRDLSHP